MSSGQKIPLKDGKAMAELLVNKLAPFCDKIMIAGSIRREKPEIGDIEIVCLPMRKTETDLFGAKSIGKEPIDGFVTAFRNMKIWSGAPGGRMMKLFLEAPEKGEVALPIQVDMFMPEPYDWGRILAIRTGSADYSMKVLASTWKQQGWVGTQNGLRRRDECMMDNSEVWHVQPGVKNPTIPPVFDTEERFYECMGLKWSEPKKREV